MLTWWLQLSSGLVGHYHHFVTISAGHQTGMVLNNENSKDLSEFKYVHPKIHPPRQFNISKIPVSSPQIHLQDEDNLIICKSSRYHHHYRYNRLPHMHI